MGPDWSQNFKVLRLQIAAKSFQTFPDFFNGSHKTTFGIVEILKLKF